MTVIIGGSGTANGISYFSSPTTFAGTLNVSGTANVAQGLSTVARGINNASVPSGGVLQVIQTHVTDAYSYGVSGYPTMTDTALTATITPLYSTSKIFVMIDSMWGAVASSQHISQRLKRTISGSSSYIGEATNVGSRPASIGGMGAQIAYNASSAQDYMLFASLLKYLDSPGTTSSVTYTMTVCAYSNSTLYLNRTYADRTGGTYDPRATSSVVLMEIAQ